MSSIMTCMKKGLQSVCDWMETQLSRDIGATTTLKLLKERLNEEEEDSLSIAQFHLKASNIISQFEKNCPEFQSGMTEKIFELFPWFDPNTVESTQEIQVPTGSDHMYIKSSADTREPKGLDDFFCPYEKIHELRAEDSRLCGFCGVQGDSESCGRLLPYRQGDSVHLNCALWSPEVPQPLGGCLLNVGLALNRAAKLPCSHCGEKGASLGCWKKKCSSSYHFPCGLVTGASFKKDKSFYCQKHPLSDKDDADLSDYSLERFIYINPSAESRKKNKFVNLRNISFQVGSLTVENLGYLKSEVSDDNTSALVPLDLKCSRLYWSTKDPLKVVKYHCRTRLVKKKVIKESSSVEPSFCFNHYRQELQCLSDSLSKFNRYLVKYEMNRTDWAPGIIIHPYAVSSEWDGIHYRDLHRRSIGQDEQLYLPVKVKKKMIRKPLSSRSFIKPNLIHKRPSNYYWKLNKLACLNACKLSKALTKIKENALPSGLSPSFKLQKKTSVNNISILIHKAQSTHRATNNLEAVGNLLQVDGASDDFKPTCPKCRMSLDSWSIYENHVTACKAPKRLSDGVIYEEARPSKTPRPVVESSSSNQSEEVSPRKDFSIEGLLSPPERMPSEEDGNPILVVDDDGDEEDDVVILSQTRSKPAPKPKKKIRKVSSAPSLKNSPRPAAPSHPHPFYPSDRSLHMAPPSYQVGYHYYNPLMPQQHAAQFSYVTTTPAGYVFNQNSFFPSQQATAAAAIYFNQQQTAAYSQNLFGGYAPASLPPLPPPPSMTPQSIIPPPHNQAASTSISSSSSSNNNNSTTKSKKKIARVHPQPAVVASQSLVDPIKALSSMIPTQKAPPPAATKQAFQPSSSYAELPIKPPFFVEPICKTEEQIKSLLPTASNFSEILPESAAAASRCHDDKTIIHGGNSRSSSGSSSTVASEPSFDTVFSETLSNGTHFSYESSKETSIKIVLQRKDTNDRQSSTHLQVQEVSVKGGESKSTVNPRAASDLLKQLKASKKKKRNLAFVSVKDEFINEVEANSESVFSPQLWRPRASTDFEDEDDYKVLYELSSEDGFKAVSCNVNELWKQVFDAVQEARMDHSLSPLPNDVMRDAGLQMLGLTHNAMSFILEQMSEEAMSMEQYRLKHQKEEPVELKENVTGCARTEMFKSRSPLDMFSWLASKHRKKPDLSTSSKIIEFETISASRRTTSLDLPIAMRFRHLAKNAKEAVGVFNSGIHGRGLICKREIQEGEMVIEYAGEEIRAVLADKRERYYESRGIGCYMFRVDDNVVIDATLKGNAARFINHCCDPNCYSKIVDVIGKKHIIIFALRTIIPGEELTYDYKFPIEDVKIPCTCGKKKCRKYMN